MVKYKVVILMLAFLAALFASLSVSEWPQGGEKVYSSGTVSGIGDVGIEIFTIYVFSFEVMALVLTAALIGAIYVARKETA